MPISLKKEGEKPYIIPFGGSNLLGSLGYVDCANEILQQFKELNNSEPNYIITATGSGGTQAGLIAGLEMKNASTKVIGFSVLHKDDTIKNIVTSLSDEILETTNDKSNLNIEVNTDYVGEGYGFPTKAGIDSIKLLAKLEGLFLCPVYTGKAMSGLIDYIKKGKINKNDSVVFIHTGGMPLVHAYYGSYKAE